MGDEKGQTVVRSFFYNKHSQRPLTEVGSGFFHRWFLALTFTFATLVCVLADVAVGRDGTIVIVNLRDPNVRRQIVERLARESQGKKAAALAIAQSQGWLVRQQINDTIFELMAIEADRIYVYKTCNVNAAISIGTNLIRNTAPYDVNGVGLTVGI